MGKILNKTDENFEKDFTLDESEVNFLNALHLKMQMMMDTFQQEIAGEYLHHIAESKFDYAPLTELQFRFNPEKTEGNLTIINVRK